jgi:signal transduction histidine kinase
MVDRATARWRTAGTVRLKLTVLATSVVATVLAVSAVELVTVQRTMLVGGIDETLSNRADAVEAELGPSIPGLLAGQGDPDDSLVQLVAPDGSVAAASANATGLPPVGRPLTATGQTQDVHTAGGLTFSEDDYRVLRRRVSTASGTVTILVGENLDDVHDSVGILATSLAVSIPVVTVLLGLLLWWLTGRVLRPVEAIRAEVATIQASELHRRVPVPTGQDEIARLARTMNKMLDRVQEATDRQQQFVADASHELRGPLTSIRSSLEVAEEHPQEVDTDALHTSLLADTAHLQKLVEDLLYVARADAGALATSKQAVDLDDLVLAEAAAVRQRGTVQVDIGTVSAARTVGDPGQLARAIRNLLDNAERHAASTMTLALREAAEDAELVVADDGAGIAPAHRQAVFERFVRLDEARTRDDGGSGLGLAIVRDIVTRHRGTVRLDSSDTGGARFIVTLPRSE